MSQWPWSMALELLCCLAGWLTGRNVGYYVRNGKRSQMPCHRNTLMWQQGDQLVLSLDCRRGRGHARITCSNTVSGVTHTMEAAPAFTEQHLQEEAGCCSSRGAGAGGVEEAAAAAAATGTAAGPAQAFRQQQQQQEQAEGSSTSSGNSKSKKKKRAGLRHRQRGDYRLAAGPDRDEVLELLRRQPADANLQVGSLPDTLLQPKCLLFVGVGHQARAGSSVLRQQGSTTLTAWHPGRAACL